MVHVNRSMPIWQSALACISIFVAGSSFALGAFTVSVERAARVPGALDGVWEIGLGFVHISSAFVSIASSIFLSALPPHERFPRVRILLVLSFLGVFSIALASVAVLFQNPLLLIAAVCPFALPLSISMFTFSFFICSSFTFSIVLSMRSLV